MTRPACSHGVPLIYDCPDCDARLERAVRFLREFGYVSAACMDDIERSVRDAVESGVTLKPAPNRRRRP